MTALLGHLMESDFSPEWKSWRMATLQHLFGAPIQKKVKQDMKGLADNLRAKSRQSEMLVIWTDCDREGENIGAEVVQVCRETNPNIIVKRARFSVVQAREIKQAWNRLVELDWRAAAAVDARTELDLRIGAVFTRFQTLQLQGHFKELSEQILSYGPCQFPTLGFVVDRFRKVQSFIPEKFWSITLEVTRNGLRAVFGWSRNHLFNRHIVLALYELCMKNPVCTISKVEAKPKSKWAPLPLTTVELQKVGSRFLHMSSDRVMQVAEALYNRGIVSYPRTETDCFDDKFDLMPLIEKQTQSQEWGSYAASLLNGKFTKPRKGKNNDQAHPPIHPVRAAFDLSGDEKKVFDYITRRFLACCSAAARGQETVVDLELSQEKFTSSGLMILERNYLEVFPYEKWSDSDIPTFSVGERVEPSLLEMREGSTTRPTMLTEADLITLMDKSGIGTDATIHEHIKKILDREYARKENIYFFPTTLGMALVTAYDEMDIDLSLSRPFLRSLTEANMKKICDGARQREDVVSESIELYKNVFIAAFGQASKLHESCAKFFGHAPDATPQRADRFNDVAIRNCPKCRLPMTLRVLPNNTKMIGCSGYPACREVLFLPSFVTNVAKSENTCSTCGNATEPTSKLQLSFRPHSVPPTIPLEYDTCVWCDDQLLELFSFERGRNRAPPQQQSGSTISENIHNYPPPPPPSAGAAAITTSFSSTPLTQISPPRYNAPQHHPLQTNQRNPTFNSVDEDAQMCLCLMPLLELTVRKEGPNQGRIFLSCPKPKDDPTRCHIFQWKDDMAQNRDQSFGERSGGSRSSHTQTCSCLSVCSLLTVRKEGPNQGRQFYACSKAQTDPTRCTFFLWVDDQSVTTGKNGESVQRQHAQDMPGYNSIGRTSNNSSRPRCQCDLIAVSKTAQGDGPNKGRQYYTCAKSAAQCRFFAWADESLPRNGPTGSANTNNDSATNLTCFNCNQVGHFSSNCPQPKGKSSSSRGRGSRGRGRGRGRGKLASSSRGRVSKSQRGKGRGSTSGDVDF